MVKFLIAGVEPADESFAVRVSYFSDKMVEYYSKNE